MIGELIPQIYDVNGKPTGSPISDKRTRLFHATFPMGRFVSQPLSQQCKDINELRCFLSKCRYVSDKEQFDRKDYWMPPEEFEVSKKGDCEDFALWTWRQLLAIGYKARYVVGTAGKYGEGHAWVTIEKDGKHFLVESMAHYVGAKLPRLSVVRYFPSGSVEWDGKKLHYFMHSKPDFNLPIKIIPALVCEWLFFWSLFWLRFFLPPCLLPYYLIRKLIRKFFFPASPKTH